MARKGVTCNNSKDKENSTEKSMKQNYVHPAKKAQAQPQGDEETEFELCQNELDSDVQQSVQAPPEKGDKQVKSRETSTTDCKGNPEERSTLLASIKQALKENIPDVETSPSGQEQLETKRDSLKTPMLEAKDICKEAL